MHTGCLLGFDESSGGFGTQASDTLFDPCRLTGILESSNTFNKILPGINNTHTDLHSL